MLWLGRVLLFGALWLVEGALWLYANHPWGCRVIAAVLVSIALFSLGWMWGLASMGLL